MTREQLLSRKRELDTKIKQLDAKQLSLKILLNSTYGYFGNKQAPIGDDDIASSITLTGQAVVKHAREIAKAYISEQSGITDDNTLETSNIAGDTDSLYLSLRLIPMKFVEDGKLTQQAHHHTKQLNDRLNRDITTFAKSSFNAKDPRFVFKREAMADTGMFLEKKRYVIHLLDNKGIPCDKWKYTGVDVVRTTMPTAVKPYVKRIIETMLTTRSISKTNQVVLEAYDVFNKLPIEDISRTCGIKGYEKYASQCNEFKIAKRTPNHVKAAYFHNLLIGKLGLTNKYPHITSGDKMKYFYVQIPNKYNIDVVGFKSTFPDEMKDIFTPDREKLFEKIVFATVERFYESVKWTPRKPSQQIQTDLFDLFGM